MFKDNKYTKWYWSIVSRADSTAEYTEVHHIVPKSLGGTDEATNLVRVSGRQHFVLHLLLIKMVDGRRRSKMAWALHRMAFSGLSLKSGEYAMARKIHRKNVALPKTAEHQAKIAASLRGQKRTAEHKRNMSIGAKKRDPATRIQSPEHTEKVRAKLKGVPKTTEHCEKLRQSALGRKLTAEAKSKMSATTKGIPKGPMSAETKAKLSASKRARDLARLPRPPH